MSKTKDTKDKLRAEISLKKKQYTSEDLKARSEEVLSVVEITGMFQEAKTVLIYNSLADEVQTTDFIRRWSDKKEFYLPVVVSDDLVFRRYHESTEFKQSSIGIKEPLGVDFKDYKKIDLIIVPGVAFDRKKNRMGRGKGYYDRFLQNISAPKMGICFDFQLLNDIPVDKNDIKMDYIISENDLIW
ncbi:MAG: 5-formyltetrahydrofolate cyclo-ligase [Dysgonomonas sp.]|nr:5-formyltetrahydrofolate cyclo-ligase [Dysgonomonas sp.]